MKRTLEMAAECAQFPDDMSPGERVWCTAHLRQRIFALQWRDDPRDWNVHALARNGKLFALQEWGNAIPRWDRVAAYRTSPIALAAAKGHLGVVKWLCTVGKFNIRQDAIMAAAEHSHVDVAAYLLGRDPSMRVDKAMGKAVARRCLAMFCLLARAGAHDGAHVFQHSAMHCRAFDIARYICRNSQECCIDYAGLVRIVNGQVNQRAGDASLDMMMRWLVERRDAHDAKRHLRRVISGGQTGADAGALRAAHGLGVATGGWAPPAFATERGPDPTLGTVHGLREMHTVEESAARQYVLRSQRNVDDADATLAFRTQASAGTDRTIGYAVTGSWAPIELPYVGQPAQRLSKEPNCPDYRRTFVVTDVSPAVHGETVAGIVAFLRRYSVRTLNVAGHRESKHAGLGERVERILSDVLRQVGGPPEN